VYKGDVSMENILRIAVQLRDVVKKSDAKTFEGTVKEVLGTAKNLGFTVDGQNPINLQRRISKGTFQVSPEGVMPYVQWLHECTEPEEYLLFSEPRVKEV